MTNELRKHSRIPLVMEVLWDGANRSQARTTDISEGGCFIDTVGHVAVGEILNLRLLAPDGDYISVLAQVIYQMPRFGFGVRFTETSDSDRSRLRALLNPEEQEAFNNWTDNINAPISP